MTLVPELFVRRLNKPKGLPINVRDVSVTGDGQTDDYAALNEAVRSAGATGTLYFPAGTYVVGTNLTIPACCIFAFGAKLKPSSGVTVTLSGPVELAPGESVIATGTAGTVSITGAIESGGGVLDVRAFGAVGDGVTNDRTAIQAALTAASAAGGGVVYLPVGTYRILSGVSVASNVHVVCDGNIDASSTSPVVNPAINFNNAVDASWTGGTVTGNNTTDTQTAFRVGGTATRVTLSRFSVASFKNKGVDVRESATDIVIEPIRIEGANGTTGVGVSIFSVDAHRVTLRGGYLTNNRFGISFNGGTNHTIIAPQCIGNTECGASFDGVVTDAGDAPKYSSIIGGNYDNNGFSGFGGIYFGNGANYNRIVGVSCKGNTGSGIRSSATTGVNENIGNVIVGAVCEGNARSGIELSNSPETIITAPVCRLNTSRGIYLFTSDRCTVSDGILEANVGTGLQVWSADSTIANTRITDNATGVLVGFGGTASPVRNVVRGCVVTGNSTADFNINNGLVRVEQTTGTLTTFQDMTDASLSVTLGTIQVVRLDVPIAADRTLTLNNTNVTSGAVLRVVRTAAATGAFNLVVTASGLGVLKNMGTAGTWAECTFDGSFWRLTAFGTL